MNSIMDYTCKKYIHLFMINKINNSNKNKTKQKTVRHCLYNVNTINTRIYDNSLAPFDWYRHVSFLLNRTKKVCKK